MFMKVLAKYEKGPMQLSGGLAKNKCFDYLKDFQEIFCSRANSFCLMSFCLLFLKKWTAIVSK